MNYIGLIFIVLLWGYYIMYIVELCNDYISPINTKRQALIYLIPFSMWAVLIIEDFKK